LWESRVAPGDKGVGADPRPSKGEEGPPGEKMREVAEEQRSGGSERVDGDGGGWGGHRGSGAGFSPAGGRSMRSVGGYPKNSDNYPNTSRVLNTFKYKIRAQRDCEPLCK
jgi:hypothetical protein